MKIFSVNDSEFAPYGKVIDGYDLNELLSAMKDIDMPETGVCYEPSIASLEACGVFGTIENNAYGGMPVQLGMCWGFNTKLNCVEYHRDSELNLGTEDFILLVAKQHEIVNGVLDTECIKAFYVPAGVLTEVYATTLHYAPCSAYAAKGFRVMVALPRGTNTAKPDIEPKNTEDGWLRARNKWLVAHPESAEAADGAYVGIKGENTDIKDLIN